MIYEVLCPECMGKLCLTDDNLKKKSSKYYCPTCHKEISINAMEDGRLYVESTTITVQTEFFPKTRDIHHRWIDYDIGDLLRKGYDQEDSES